jgi:hypothetical protein
MKIACAAPTLALLLTCLPAHAGPDQSIASTYLDDGQRRIDFKYGSVRPGGEARLSAYNVGFGMGIDDRWFSEIYAGWERSSGEGSHLDAVAWMNAFLLTHGQYPVDLGLYTEIERPQDRTEGYEVTFGPLLQTDFGRTQANLNLLFVRNYRAQEANAMQLEYQWQLKHRWKHALQFGLQGFGELGKWNNWAPHQEQSHRLGPAIFAAIALDGKRELGFNAALLFRVAGVDTGTTFRTQVVLGF